MAATKSRAITSNKDRSRYILFDLVEEMAGDFQARKLSRKKESAARKGHGQQLKSTWHSPYILVYMDSLLNYLLVSAPSTFTP